MSPSFYTYLHRRNDTGQVFYVGKGRGYRATQKTARSQHWHRIARKHGRSVEIVAFWATELEAFDHEIFLIDTFRALGEPLVNVAAGGQGASGVVQPAEVIAKRRLSMMRPESIAKKSAALRASWRDPEVRSRRASRYIISPEEAMRRAEAAELAAENRRRETAERQRMLWQTPAYRELTTEKVRSAKSTAASRSRQSEITRALWQRPEYAACQRESIALRMREPDARARASETFLQVWRDPEHRAAMSSEVVCLDTGEKFESISAAARAIGDCKANVSKVCYGKRKTCRGKRFAFADNEGEKNYNHCL